MNVLWYMEILYIVRCLQYNVAKKNHTKCSPYQYTLPTCKKIAGHASYLYKLIWNPGNVIELSFCYGTRTPR